MPVSCRLCPQLYQNSIVSLRFPFEKTKQKDASFDEFRFYPNQSPYNPKRSKLKFTGYLIKHHLSMHDLFRFKLN